MKKIAGYTFYFSSRIYFVILLFLCLNMFLSIKANAMGVGMFNSNDNFEDQGIIGEKKTRQGRQTYVGAADITYTRYTGNTRFVTPKVEGGTAYFNVMREYSFNLDCLGWKYEIKAGYIGLTEKELLNWNIENKVITGWRIILKSQNNKIEIETKKINLPTVLESDISIIEKQNDTAVNSQSSKLHIYSRGERILAAQQAIRWTIDNDLNSYSLIDKTKPLEFSLELVGKKEFIKSEVDVSDGTQSKKCIIWAINCRDYKHKSNEFRIEAWVAKIITDIDNLGEVLNKTHMIFETVKFYGPTVYADLRDKYT